MQIFFNTTHLGGSDDVKALASSGQLVKLHRDMRGTRPPTAADFQRPAHPPAPKPKRAPLTEPQICIGGQCMTYGAVLRMLKTGGGNGKVPLRITTHFSRGKRHELTFTGSNLVDVLLSHFSLPGGATFSTQALALSQSKHPQNTQPNFNFGQCILAYVRLFVTKLIGHHIYF